MPEFFWRGRVIEVRWAHPLWHQYLVTVCDLTTPISGQTEPTVRYFPGATHELDVIALNPEFPVPTGDKENVVGLNYLTPFNHVYQWRGDNVLAEERFREVLSRIEKRTLSPDTDFSMMWDGLYDWVSGKALPSSVRNKFPA